MTLILVILATLWAPLIERFDSLWRYLQEVLAFIAPPVASTFILGLFWKRASSTGSIVSLLFGLVAAVFTILSIQYGWVDWLNDMHFLHRTAYLFALCMLLHVVVSLFSAPPLADQVEQYTWKRPMFRAETRELRGVAWYKNYRVLAAILLIVTAIVVGMFW